MYGNKKKYSYEELHKNISKGKLTQDNVNYLGKTYLYLGGNGFKNEEHIKLAKQLKDFVAKEHLEPNITIECFNKIAYAYQHTSSYRSGSLLDNSLKVMNKVANPSRYYSQVEPVSLYSSEYRGFTTVSKKVIVDNLTRDLNITIKSQVDTSPKQIVREYMSNAKYIAPNMTL